MLGSLYMIKIAVLDDDKEYITKICDITKQAMFQLNLVHDIQIYNDINIFLRDLNGGIYYDIYLLDVEMPQMNGLEVAKNIRKKYNEPIIIYITNYADYAIEAFEVNAYRYILKKNIEEKLLEAYNVLLVKKTNASENVYMIKSKNSLVRIPYRNIIYLQKDGKYVSVVHKDGKNRVRMSLEEVVFELKSEEFVFIDRSFVVNIKNIISLKCQQLKMVDGSILTISKPRLQQVINKIVKLHEKR